MNVADFSALVYIVRCEGVIVDIVGFGIFWAVNDNNIVYFTLCIRVYQGVSEKYDRKKNYAN